MSRMLTTVSALLLVAVGGCASTLSSVPVKGSDADVSRLAGKWQGNYESTATGREGTIAFDLGVGRHTAEARVTMSFGGGDVRPLEIEFLAVSETTVTGKLAAYVDPACDCTVETEFSGQLDGGVIDGTFVTHRAGEQDGMIGYWSVKRTSRY